MFTTDQIPELKPLTEKQRNFVLMMPQVGWNQSEAARKVYGSKWAAYRTASIKTDKVEAAIQALRRAIEEKAVAENVWTFEQARARSLSILRICEERYMREIDEGLSVKAKADAFSDCRHWMARAQATIHELNLQHGYLGERPALPTAVHLHYNDERRLDEIYGMTRRDQRALPASTSDHSLHTEGKAER